MTGRVIRIVDTHRIIINLGAADGVAEGQRFGVYTPQDEIVDPQTSEVLGTYRERKASVVARVVAERFTICAAPRRSFAQSYFLGVRGGVAEQVAPHLQDPTELPVERRQINPLPTGSTIKVGDFVQPIAPQAEGGEGEGVEGESLSAEGEQSEREGDGA